MATTSSPLRYPGGKGQLEGFITELLALQGMKDVTYIEPFAGGAGLALSLLLSNKVKKIVINDFDLAIYAVWHSILNETERFISKIESTSITIEEWFRQKDIYSSYSDSTDLLTLGFSTFFLNRTNRSGILKAGVIGGKEQLGTYKLDCRFNKCSLIQKIRAIAARKDDIVISNLDAVVFIDSEVRKSSFENTFIFFDPPYFKKGRELYTNFYKADDHVKLYDSISKLNDYKWIVTYDKCGDIESLYKKYSGFYYALNYSLAVKKKALELMYCSNRLEKIFETTLKKMDLDNGL